MSPERQQQQDEEANQGLGEGVLLVVVLMRVLFVFLMRILRYEFLVTRLNVEVSGEVK
jgi:hypothetical protein